MTIYGQPNWVPGMAEDGPKVVPITDEDFRNLPSNNPQQAFIVGAPHRPGFAPFIQEIEYTMYEPDTPANGKFELMTSVFPKESDMVWFTVIIPIEDLEKVKEIAKKYQFELKQDSLPVSIDGGSTEAFPLGYGTNVYTVTGHIEDELLLKKYEDHWRDVIDKHSKGLPWKV